MCSAYTLAHSGGWRFIGRRDPSNGRLKSMRCRRLSRNSPRVWQLTNKRVSTRMARRSHFPSLITITIASKRSDGISPRLLRSPTTMSTATRHRKCESSVMGNWSEQTCTEDFVRTRRCHRFVIIISFSAIVYTTDIAPRIPKIPVS